MENLVIIIIKMCGEKVLVKCHCQDSIALLMKQLYDLPLGVKGLGMTGIV